MNTHVSTAVLDATATAGAAQPRRSAILRHLATAERVLFGLLFAVFGFNGFLNFIPPPAEPMPEGAVAFGTALFKTGYMFPLIKGTELLAGLLLLSNRFVPLALVVLAPIVVNIVAFHVFLAPTGLVMTFFVLALELHLAWRYRAAYRPLLTARAA